MLGKKGGTISMGILAVAALILVIYSLWAFVSFEGNTSEEAESFNLLSEKVYFERVYSEAFFEKVVERGEKSCGEFSESCLRREIIVESLRIQPESEELRDNAESIFVKLRNGDFEIVEDSGGLRVKVEFFVIAKSGKNEVSERFNLEKGLN